jgi:UDP-N-acetylglucosamine:LPS N-acetylglucosamine transferase
MNAYDFAKNRAAIVIEEANLLPGIFVSQARLVLTNPELQKKMGTAAKQFFMPNAAETIVDGILEAVAK